MPTIEMKWKQLRATGTEQLLIIKNTDLSSFYCSLSQTLFPPNVILLDLLYILSVVFLPCPKELVSATPLALSSAAPKHSHTF